VQLKESRVDQLKIYKNYHHNKLDLIDNSKLENIFKEIIPDAVINLAAQAGVRYSLENPQSYIDSNITGFLNILNNCVKYKVSHLIYASSSSVYGANIQMPLSTKHSTDHPLSLYAVTKKTNELMAHSYSALYKLPTTGLRFFTVYGPWGRPDMALFKFTKAIISNNEIEVFNNGEHERDFTYVDDISESIKRILDLGPPKNEIKILQENLQTGISPYPWQIFNIGNSKPIKLMNYIKELERQLNKKAKLKFLPMQLGDVEKTSADIESLFQYIDYRPKVTIQSGIKKFLDWYIDYNEI
jgi:UDP-glucuronate 4-epimerase